MTLGICVPQYKEDDKIVKPLLDSIEIQQGVDLKNVEVVIVNDGSDVFLSNELLNSYSFKITYIKSEHAGVSATRQKAFDACKTDYIMFCDADDMFFNACGLWIIFREMQIGFDSLTSLFLEQTKIPGKDELVFINREQDSTFVHGKVHRRQYLVDQNIKWNPALTIHEDSYFNILCQKCSQNVKYCPTAFYLWKWRDESVCRNDFKYILKTYNNLLDSNTALVNQFLQRNRYQEAQFYATSMVYDAYFTMNKDEWINQENKEYRDATEKRFAIYYKTFKQMVDTIPVNFKAQILQALRNRFYQEGMLLETTTFETWIKHIEDLID